MDAIEQRNELAFRLMDSLDATAKLGADLEDAYSDISRAIRALEKGKTDVALYILNDIINP